MVFKSIQLLKRLEPSIRPAYAGGGMIAPRSTLESQSFDQLMALVSDGTMRSGRPVTIDFEPAEEINDEQLERLASAADVAESAGVQRSLMLIDGRGLVLDVSGRRLVNELSPHEQDQVVTLDAAVYVAGEGERTMHGTIRFPGTGLVPPSVVKQIQLAQNARSTVVAGETHEPHQHLRRNAG